MRSHVVSILLLLALFPIVHDAFEAWEHSQHSHAAACEEGGTHTHPKEVHCQLDHFAFFSTPWEALYFHLAPRLAYPQAGLTRYKSVCSARFFGKRDARGPPTREIVVNV